MMPRTTSHIMALHIGISSYQMSHHHDSKASSA
jgi:hypothetical protein